MWVNVLNNPLREESILQKKKSNMQNNVIYCLCIHIHVYIHVICITHVVICSMFQNIQEKDKQEIEE